MKPEKITEFQVKLACEQLGIWIHTVDSKMVFNQKGRLSFRGNAPKGFPDLVGLDKTGRFYGIELKAKGKLSTIKPHQYEFVKAIIYRNGFGCIVDSVEEFCRIYRTWVSSGMTQRHLLDELEASYHQGKGKGSKSDPKSK